VKFEFKHIFFSSLIFIGVVFSCLQPTINYFSKNSKLNIIVLSVEDIDDNEDDTENKKIEFEDDYFFSAFNYSFTKTQNLKTSIFCKQQKNGIPPLISINTPPPKKLI